MVGTIVRERTTTDTTTKTQRARKSDMLAACCSSHNRQASMYRRSKPGGMPMSYMKPASHVRRPLMNELPKNLALTGRSRSAASETSITAAESMSISASTEMPARSIERFLPSDIEQAHEESQVKPVGRTEPGSEFHTGPVDVDAMKPIVDLDTREGPVDVDDISSGDFCEDEIYYFDDDDESDFESVMMSYEVGFQPHVVTDFTKAAKARRKFSEDAIPFSIREDKSETFCYNCGSKDGACGRGRFCV